MSNFRDSARVRYRWTLGVCNNTLGVERGANLGVPDAGSHGEFIIEHYWGYTKRGEDRTDEYKVEHPKWELFAADNPHVAVDFGATYGKEFSFLSDSKPSSVLLAAGSEIAVYKGKTIHY